MLSRSATVLAALLAATGALSACGTSNSASTVETVTVTRPQSTAAPATRPAGGAATTTAAPDQNPTKTRTSSAPAFTGGTGASTSPAGARAAAVARLRGLGFTPLDTSTYHADQTLRVLIGARTGSADERTQRAFFFNGARFLGTDTADTSAEIRVEAQSDTEVTLSYGIYRGSDPLCCPQGGTRRVRFQLDMGKLAPVDSLPSAAARR